MVNQLNINLVNCNSGGYMSNFKNLVIGIFAFCFVAFNSLSAAGDFNLNYLEIDRNSYITLNEIGDTEANVIFEFPLPKLV